MGLKPAPWGREAFLLFKASIFLPFLLLLLVDHWHLSSFLRHMEFLIDIEKIPEINTFNLKTKGEGRNGFFQVLMMSLSSTMPK